MVKMNKTEKKKKKSLPPSTVVTRSGAIAGTNHPRPGVSQ